MDEKLVTEIQKLLFDVQKLLKLRIDILENKAIAETKFFTARLYSIYLKHIERLQQKLEAYYKDAKEYKGMTNSSYKDITKRLERLLFALELDVRNAEIAAEVIPVTAHKQQLGESKKLAYLLNILLEHHALKIYRNYNKKHWGTKQDLDFLDYTLLRLLKHPSARESHLEILINARENSYKNLEPTKLSSKINLKDDYPVQDPFKLTFNSLRNNGLSVQEIALESINNTYLLNPKEGDGSLMRNNNYVKNK